MEIYGQLEGFEVNNFLGCQKHSGKAFWGLLFVSSFIGASAFGLSVDSELKLESMDRTKATTATLDVSVGEQKYTCRGGFRFNSFSIMSCGDQRQVQVEIQTVNSSENALISVYEPGRQDGLLFLATLSGEGYQLVKESAVVIPGFGNVQIFSKYVYDPIVSNVGEASAAIALPLWIQSLTSRSGTPPTLGNLKDQVANEGYKAFVPKPVEAQPEPQQEVPSKTEPKAKAPEVQKTPEESKGSSNSEESAAESVESESSDQVLAPPPGAEEVNEPEGMDVSSPRTIPTPVPRPKREQRPASKTKGYEIIESESKRPKIIEIKKTPRHADEKTREIFFDDPKKDQRPWVNPFGLDIGSMSPKELKDHVARGLIWRE